MPVSAETMAQVAELTRELLEARFGDDFIFGPILVMSKIDQYGDEYVEIKTVYDGDRKNLDPGWTAGLSRRTREALDELGVPGLPASFGFVKKSAGKPGRPRKPHEPVRLIRLPAGPQEATL